MDGVCAPRTDEALHEWIAKHLGYRIPRRALCPGHAAPFAPLADLFFERVDGAVLWANRGGGKTLVLAALGFVEALSKPGVDILGLGGSLAQAEIGFGYVQEFFDRAGLRDEIQRETRSSVTLTNGSRITIVPASTRRARGPHPHKLRCDEVDECPPDVFWAAMQTPQSAHADGVVVRRSVALSSTLHKPYGTMQQLVDDHAARGLHLYKWCYREVAEPCTLRAPGVTVSDAGLRDSGTRYCPADCPLLESCAGALRNADGYLQVRDLQAHRRVNDRATWEVEWECVRPGIEGSVYDPELIDRAVHAVERDPRASAFLGVDWGYVNPTVILVTQERGDRIEVLFADYYRRRPLSWRLNRIAELVERYHAQLVYTDATGVNENVELRALGVQVVPVSFQTDKVRGIAAIRAAFEEDRLRIAPSLREFIGELKRYHYREGTEEVVKQDDHGPDALCVLFKRYQRFAPEVARTRLGQRTRSSKVNW